MALFPNKAGGSTASPSVTGQPLVSRVAVDPDTPSAKAPSTIMEYLDDVNFKLSEAFKKAKALEELLIG